MSTIPPKRRVPSLSRIGLSWAAWFLASLLGAALAQEDGPVNVRVERLGDLLQVPVFSAPASVVARNAPRLAAEIDARLLELTVAVGDRVSTGQVLARLDCRRLESALASAGAALNQAQARLAFAEEQLERARNLKRNKNISEELLDQRRTDLAAGTAELQAAAEARRQAAIDVGHCEIRSPFDAVVTERASSVGDFVTRGRAIVGLLETAAQEASVALRHEEVEGFLAAPTLSFDGNGRTLPVRLRALLPMADPVTRTREARLQFVDEAAIVGSAGRIVWHGPRTQLPAEYLVRREGDLGVFVLDRDSARFIAVPGAEDGRPASVDLPPDTLLITDGRQRLADGDRVTPVPAGETPQ